jgi:hypothetical protein
MHVDCPGRVVRVDLVKAFRNVEIDIPIREYRIHDSDPRGTGDLFPAYEETHMRGDVICRRRVGDNARPTADGLPLPALRPVPRRIGSSPHSRRANQLDLRAGTWIRSSW